MSELMERLEQEGWTKGLAYRFARDCSGDDYSVCVRCGWPWPGPNNRCVNDECRGFCTWGETYGGEPTSWVKLPSGGYRPRMIGEDK
jgi:hypothetical protein